ncbi:hypothetical protein LCGC14_0535300, partial [marine sediment metagenome]
RVKSAGDFGIGTNNPGAKLEILNAGDQLKLSFDGTDNAIFAVDTNGVLTITPSGAAVDFAFKALINVLDLDLGSESAAGTIWAMLTAANAGTALVINSRDSIDIHRARLGLSGGVDTAVWAWFNSTHTGIVLSGALDVDTQHIKMKETTDPTAIADEALLYARLVNGGKTELVVRFQSGAVQVLATEP